MNGPGPHLDVEIEFPPQPEFVGVARHVIAALARMSDLAPEVAEDVKLAVSEACTNAVTVTTRAGSTDPVTVQGRLMGRRLHLWVSDRGAERDLADAVEGNTDSMDFSFERGLSLPLLKGLVDELDIRPREGGGNIVEMVLSDRE